MTKHTLVAELTPHIVKMNPDKSADDIRSHLDRMSDQDLQNAYDSVIPLDADTERRIAAQAELHIAVDNKRVQQNEQHMQQARADWPNLACQLGISEHESNFQIIQGLHSSVRNVDDITQFISDGRLQFIPASPEEVAQRESVEAQKIVHEVWTSLRGHLVRKVVGGSGPQNDFDVFGQISFGESQQQNQARQIRALLQLPLETLRQLHQRAQENQAVKQGQQVERPPAPVDPNLNSGSLLDQHTVPVGGSYQVLPKVTKYNEPLDAKFLVRLANESFSTYKEWVRKYGYRQLTERIRGIS
jgi:hypothetical protein